MNTIMNHFSQNGSQQNNVGSKAMLVSRTKMAVSDVTTEKTIVSFEMYEFIGSPNVIPKENWERKFSYKLPWGNDINFNMFQVERFQNVNQ